jgi:hypothetical protein
MKKITYLFATTIIVSSFLFVSCSDDDDTDEVVVTSSILGDWTVSSVTAPSDATAQDWSNMTISITGSDAGGTLTSSDGPDCGVPVMPETTPWIYTDDTNTMISRDDDVNMSISGLTDNAMSLSFNVNYDFPALDSTKGFLESFTYSDDTNVREDITYPEGIINEWPMGDANDENGGNVSISEGKLIWEYTKVLEAAIGWEFEEGIDISENPTLSFDYQLPLGTIFSVYMFGGEGEGQLFAPDDYNLILGADSMNEVSINLSNSSAKEGADPNSSSMEEFYGFYMIVGMTDPDPNSENFGGLLPDAEGSLLVFDNINVGGVSLCTEASVSGDWTFSLTK